MTRATEEWIASDDNQAIPAMTCAFCKKPFQRTYRISAKRAARPQYCSRACFGRAHAAKSSAAFAEKFWARLKPANERGCRDWSGRTFMRYGLVDLWNRPQMAHRVAYRLATGIDPGPLEVCHTCDNPPCCEPSHLWLGTHKENMLDMAAKGRTNPPIFLGEKHPQARLVAEDVIAIRSSPNSNNDLAAAYGVTVENIRRVRLYQTWAHI